MSQPPLPSDEPPPFLEGDDALQWYYSTEGGGPVLDRHLAAIWEVFGPEAVRPKAATNYRTGAPHTLVLEVLAHSDDTQAQDELLRVQGLLMADRAFLQEMTVKEEPYENIVVTLGLPPRDWPALSREITGDGL